MTLPRTSPSMFYFAYGSNMLTERLRARVPSAEPVATAVLPGHALRFHKRSRDGSGKCNVVEADAGSSRVHGVLFEYAPDDLSALDAAEHRGHGYERQQLDLRAEGTRVEAFAYVAQPAYVDDALHPYGWYQALVAAGAHQHALPPSYRAEIADVRSYPDPDEDRSAHYRTLLRNAGLSHAWPET